MLKLQPLVALFSRFISRIFDPAALNPGVRRREVLSWAGRTQEAQTAFESLLAAQPDDARAARGLARVYRWSGQKGRADRWYETSLSIEDDTEARQEREAMRGQRVGLVLCGGNIDLDLFRDWVMGAA